MGICKTRGEKCSEFINSPSSYKLNGTANLAWQAKSESNWFCLMACKGYRTISKGFSRLGLSTILLQQNAFSGMCFSISV